jgi:hypothetical protein
MPDVGNTQDLVAFDRKSLQIYNNNNKFKRYSTVRGKVGAKGVFLFG